MADQSNTPTLAALLEGMGLEPGELQPFRPGFSYNPHLDWLIVLTEDVGYVSQSLRIGDVEVLWHPHEPRMVGIKLWSVGRTKRGRDMLRRAGLIPEARRKRVKTEPEVEAEPEADPRLAAAADSLDRIGKFHGWWPDDTKAWSEAGPVERGEFLALVQEVINAYGVTARGGRRGATRGRRARSG